MCSTGIDGTICMWLEYLRTEGKDGGEGFPWWFDMASIDLIVQNVVDNASRTR